MIPTNTPTPTPTEDLAGPFDKINQATRISYNSPFGLQDTVAYRIEDSQMVAFNHTNIQNPETILQSDYLGEQVSGIDVVGNQAFVLADNELFIWNVKIPEQPTLTTKLPIEGQLFLDAENKRMHLVTLMNEQAEIVTIDISNPLNPLELGRAMLPWTTPLYYPSKIAQNHIVLIHNDYIEVFDISDPNSVILTATISLPTNINTAIELKGNLLIVSTSSEMTMIDLSSTNRPVQLSEYDNFQISTMSISGDTAHLFWQICGWEPSDNDEVSGGCGYGIDLVDISNPTEPKSKGILRFETETNQQWFDTNRIYGQVMYLETGEYLEEGPEYHVLDLTGIDG